MSKNIDPTSGSGSLLINIGKAVARRNNSEDGIKYYAQELKQNTYNLTRMNLVMRGILPDNIVTRNGDTLEADWPYFDESDPIGTYDPLYVDACVSNPPYSQNWDPADKDVDARFSYGLAPKSKADYAFLLHDLYHLRPEGIMTIVLPHGVLFRGGEEGVIRKNLIEHRHIEAIIGLPANIFFGTGIPTIIMVLRQKRETSDVLIIDASKGFEKKGKQNVLRACDIKKIADTVADRTTIEGFSRLVDREEIRENDYNLNIPRYVDSSEPAERWDIYASMFGGIPTAEIDALQQYWEAWPALRGSLFSEDGTPYAKIKTDNVRQAVEESADIVAYFDRFSAAFDGFEEVLSQQLVDDPEGVSVAEEETIISADIFSRIANLPLIDRYAAYQVLDNAWQQIGSDLEIIKTEGFGAVTTVDPNMVVKKKGGKDQEVQDGWVGRIVPFDLAQEVLLGSQTQELASKQMRLSDIGATYGELLDSLSEEDKDSVAINDAGDAFVAAEAKRIAKEYKDVKPEEGSFEACVVEAARLMDEEKTLKAAIKKDSAQLQQDTKNTIETMDDNQARKMLEEKWISPIVVGLKGLPSGIVDTFIGKVGVLATKYEVTYAQVAGEIKDAESTLVEMISGLTGGEYDMRGLAELQSLLGGE